MREGAAGFAILVGFLHALVDAATVSAAYRTTYLQGVSDETAFGLILIYDLVAFGSQVLLGFGIDRWANPKAAMLAGLALAFSGVAAVGVDSTATVALVGAGNALFHLGAGASVLRFGLDRALPSGLFVAPGALGLGFGIFYGNDPALGPVWPFFVALALAAALVASRPGVPPLPPERRPAGPPSFGVASCALALLLASIAIRSLVGFSAPRGCPKGPWLALGIPIAACLGKSLGGWLADRIGWMEASVAALLASAPLLALTEPGVPQLLAGLTLFQMTMPVTLVATARLMPGRLATAFGWTCLAIEIGAWPVMFSWGDPLCERAILLAWILAAATVVFYGLRLAGVGRGFRPGAAPEAAPPAGAGTPCKMPPRWGTNGSAGASWDAER